MFPFEERHKVRKYEEMQTKIVQLIQADGISVV